MHLEATARAVTPPDHDPTSALTLLRRYVKGDPDTEYRDSVALAKRLEALTKLDENVTFRETRCGGRASRRSATRTWRT